MALVRVVDGLLFDDDFSEMPDGPVTGYKEPHDFVSGTVASRHDHGDFRPFDEVWEIRDGALQLNLLEANGHYWLMRDGIEAVTGMVVQSVAEFEPGGAANISGQEVGVVAAASEGYFSGEPGLNAIWAETLRGDGFMVKFGNLALDDGGGGMWFVNAIEDPTDPTVAFKIAVAPPSQLDPPAYGLDETLMRLWIAGEYAECGTAEAWEGGREFPPLLLPAGVAGVHLRKNGGAGTPYPARWFRLSSYRSNVVRAQGLEDGQVLRVGGIEAVSAAGVAEVDLGGMECPLPAVEVLDGPGGLVIDTFEPEGGVWGGDVYEPGEPAPPPPEIEFHREASGLIVYDDFTQAPDGALRQWHEPHQSTFFHQPGVSGDWEVRSGALSYRSDLDGMLVRGGLPPRATMVVQARARNGRGRRFGLLARVSGEAVGDTTALMPVLQWMTDDPPYRLAHLLVFGRDSVYGGGLWEPEFIVDEPRDAYTMKMVIEHDSEAGLFYGDPIGTLFVEGAPPYPIVADNRAWPASYPVPDRDGESPRRGDACRPPTVWRRPCEPAPGYPILFPPGGAGLVARGHGTGAAESVVQIEHFAVYASNIVRVHGLEDGMVLRIGERDTIVDGGLAVVDLEGMECPLSALEVLDRPVDDGGVVIVTFEPEGGVWGGDVYSADVHHPDLGDPLEGE